jgi:hypothetical protein
MADERTHIELLKYESTGIVHLKNAEIRVRQIQHQGTHGELKDDLDR